MSFKSFLILICLLSFDLFMSQVSYSHSPAEKKGKLKMEKAQSEKIVTTASGLKYIDKVVGTGASPKQGQTVTVHYTGTLTNGTKFDSSVDRGQPFETQIGVGRVIKGWDEGVPGMKIGGKRRLTIPPDMGYGSQAVGNIPPNSTLIFEVELLDIK